MTLYVLKRVLYAFPTLFAVSLVAFLIIQLPPGDFLSTTMSRLDQAGVDRASLDALRAQYGLDRPVLYRYALWMQGILLEGNFGYSFAYNRPVDQLIWERVGLTMVVSISALMFTWIVAFPIGILSAVRQYRPIDHVATAIGFIGLSIPNFLLALVLMVTGFVVFGQSIGGLFSPEFEDAPWNVGKVLDLLAHLWVPMIVVGTAGTASLVRVLRANLLDELRQPYVVAARARGLAEWRLVLRYPVRLALNPFVSTLAWLLPALVSGSAIVSIVLNLPTAGPMLLDALLAQDMYLAGAFLLLLSALTVIGTLLSDLLLAVLDPRIRYR